MVSKGVKHDVQMGIIDPKLSPVDCIKDVTAMVQDICRLYGASVAVNLLQFFRLMF